MLLKHSNTFGVGNTYLQVIFLVFLNTGIVSSPVFVLLTNTWQILDEILMISQYFSDLLCFEGL